MDSTGRPTTPVVAAGQAGAAAEAPGLPMQPAPAGGQAATGTPPVVGAAGAMAGGSGGALGPVPEDAACPPLDGGLPDGGMIDAGADAAIPDCDDDAGM